MSRKQTYDNPYKDIINMKKVPLLPLDNRWHMLFPNSEKSSYITKLEREVMRLVKQESNVSRELKQLIQLKKKLLNEIVNNMSEQSQSDSETLRKKKLEKSEQLVREINDKIDKLEADGLTLPDRLVKANEALLMASIDDCYNRINRNEEQIRVLNQWIEKTREELKNNLIIKQEKEEVNQNIYTYMHDMFGPKFMEIFDKDHNIE